MFDMRDVYNPDVVTNSLSAQQADALKSEGFTPQEIENLQWARYCFERGNLSEWGVDGYRLRFARWLYDRGRISG